MEGHSVSSASPRQVPYRRTTPRRYGKEHVSWPCLGQVVQCCLRYERKAWLWQALVVEIAPDAGREMYEDVITNTVEVFVADALMFRTRKDFRDWLALNSSHAGIWLVFGKDDSVVTLTAAEALEEALCVGWIDGLIERINEVTYRKYFSPRRKGSRWSERNKALVAKLMDQHLMTPKGLEVIERSKQDGTWDIVQDRSLPVERYGEFEQLIEKSPKAVENFRKMSKSTRQQFVGLYFDAKREATRVKRLAHLIDLLEQNRKPM